MAKNWTAYEAAKELYGANKENIAEIGSRYPLLTRVVCLSNDAYLLDVLAALPKVTARVVETGLKDIGDVETEADEAVEETKEKAKANVSDFKRGIVQGQETRQTQRADKLQQHRQNIADKRMELQKAQEAKQAGRTTDGSATTGATRPHDRPVTASPASKTDTGKVQEIKRPVTTDKVHTEPIKAQPVKERPLASGTDRKTSEPVLQKHGTRLNGVELNQQTTRKERNIKKATLNMTGKKGRKK